MTDVATDIPRCFSISIQSEVAVFLILLDFTAPAIWIAPPKRSSFSVRVVLPASGWEMMAKVRLRAISSVSVDKEIVVYVIDYFFCSFSQLSFSAMVRLKTRWSGVEE